ncbi:MAG: hypothetical protein ABI273_06425 [Lacunisphaera sp.]
MNSVLLSHLIKSELEAQRAVNYAFWHALPASSTQRALAFLEQPLPVSASILEMHDEAIEGIITGIVASDQKEPRPYPKALRDWHEQCHQPWRFGVAGGEWHFKNFQQKKKLAGNLLMLRADVARIPPVAKTLFNYYAGVSDDELKRALTWKPPLTSVFVRAFVDRLAVMQLPVEQLQGSTEKRFRIRTEISNLQVELDFQGGAFTYDVYGFFSKPQSSAHYEAFLGIGNGEWDLLSNGSEKEAAALFANVVKKILDWDGELKKNP